MTSRQLKREGGIRIGCGSAYFNDRVDAAVELVEKGGIDVLMFETLAERTLALLPGRASSRWAALLGEIAATPGAFSAGLREAPHHFG